MRSLSKVYKHENIQFSYAKPYVLDDVVVNPPMDTSEQITPLTAVYVQADEILAEARRQADSIIEKAENQAEMLKQQIFEQFRSQGYEQGYRDGYADGMKAGQEQYDDMLAQAKQMLVEAQQEKIKAMQEAESEMVDLAIEIAAQVLEHELSTNRETVVYLVQKALKKCYQNNGITVRVRDEDYGTLIEHLKEFTSAKGEKANITVLKDNSIALGTCLVETPTGVIDASIDTQIDKIKAELKALPRVVNT